MKQEGTNTQKEERQEHRIEAFGVTETVGKMKNAAPTPRSPYSPMFFLVCENFRGFICCVKAFKISQRIFSVLYEEFSPLVKFPKNECNHAEKY
jgi:hypothetical protein